MVSVDPSQMWRNFALIFPYIFFNIVAAYVIPPLRLSHAPAPASTAPPPLSVLAMY